MVNMDPLFQTSGHINVKTLNNHNSQTFQNTHICYKNRGECLIRLSSLIIGSELIEV